MKLPPHIKPHHIRPFRRALILIFALLLIANSGIFTYIYLHRYQAPPPSADTSISYDPPYSFDYSWVAHTYVAHALGAINDHTYTNSLEALEENYRLGQRVFEADFMLLDDEIILLHDYDTWLNFTNLPEGTPLSLEKFQSTLFFEQYHPLTLSDLAYLMQKYPDLYIVTDTKAIDEATNRLIFEKFVSTISALNPDLLSRFVIQIYHPDMLDWIMEVYPWRSVIYTLYNDPDWTPDSVLAFSEASGVKFITMWGSLATPEVLSLWLPSGIEVCAHTLNNLVPALELLQSGVTCIYTDSLLPI